jgi:hypothetical protein
MFDPLAGRVHEPIVARLAAASAPAGPGWGRPPPRSADPGWPG